MRHHLAAGLVVGLLLLGTGACGNDEQKDELSGDEKQAAEALATSMQRTNATEADVAFGECLSEGVVDELGVDKLTEAQLLTKDGVGRFGRKVDRATAEVIGEVSVACYDFAAIVEDRKAGYPKVSEQGWETYIACVDGLDDELRASVTEANLKGAGRKAQVALTAAMQKCGEPLAAAQVGNQ